MLDKTVKKAYCTRFATSGGKFHQAYQVQDPYCDYDQTTSLAREWCHRGIAQNSRNWVCSEAILPFLLRLMFCEFLVGTSPDREPNQGPKKSDCPRSSGPITTGALADLLPVKHGIVPMDKTEAANFNNDVTCLVGLRNGLPTRGTPNNALAAKISRGPTNQIPGRLVDTDR